MLNNQNERELCYAVRVTDITPIEGADKVELAHINGWHIMVKKDDYKVGDLAIYFEIDSLLPMTNPAFDFMAKYKYKVKTQRFIKGTVLSQGLLMRPDELGLKNVKEGDFLTKELGVTYYEAEDNARKASSKDLIETKVAKRMDVWKKRHRFLSRFKFICKLRRKLFEKQIKRVQKKKKTNWPCWVKKTDEDRCQNLPQLFREPLDETHWIATEKIDGTSTTFTMLQAKKRKRHAIICSRNIVFDTPQANEKNYYKDTDGNVYVEMFEKYDINAVLNHILDKHPEYEFITIQGKTYGGTIQKRKYCNEHRLAIFNIIFKTKGLEPIRLNPMEMHDFVEQINKELQTENRLECVPIVCEDFVLPTTCEVLLEYADDASEIDGGMREGLVFRSRDGKLSFKAVSNKFLEKYHG